MLVFFTGTIESGASKAPPASAFTVTAGHRTVSVGSAAISSGHTNAIVLSSFDPHVLPGQDVTVSYTDPTAAVDDVNAVQDANGLDAASFANFPVTNNSEAADTLGPVLVSAFVEGNGKKLWHDFDETLDQAVASWPPPGAFEVTADGASVTLSAIVSANRIFLSVSPTIAQGQDVIVTYTDPIGDDDPAAIQDALGNDAETFTTAEGDVPEVINNSNVAVDTTGPVLVSATVGIGGTGFSLHFNENLDPGNPPAASAFEVTADGSPVSVGDVSVDPTAPDILQAANVSPTILPGQDVIVTYTDPTGGDDTAAIQDALGNDAETFTTGQGAVPAVANNSTQTAVPAAPGSLTAKPGGGSVRGIDGGVFGVEPPSDAEGTQGSTGI